MSRSSAEVIVPVLLEVAPCDSVLDVGCGVGAWLAAFADRGVSVTGVDRDVPDAMLMIDPRHVLRHDLSLPLDLGRRFDLVISLEVAEHLPAAAAEVFVDSLVRHGDMILFSAAIPVSHSRWKSSNRPDKREQRVTSLFCVAVQLTRRRSQGRYATGIQPPLAPMQLARA